MSKIEPREFVLKDGRKCIIRTAEEADAEKVLKQIESVLAEAHPARLNPQLWDDTNFCFFLP
jgi:hypothetical protein